MFLENIHNCCNLKYILINFLVMIIVITLITLMNMMMKMTKNQINAATLYKYTPNIQIYSF